MFADPRSYAPRSFFKAPRELSKPLASTILSLEYYNNPGFQNPGLERHTFINLGRPIL